MPLRRKSARFPTGPRSDRTAILNPGCAAGEQMVKALRDFVKSTIAPYKYPRRIDFVTTLSRTETGKLQRFKLCGLAPVGAGA